MKLPTCWKSLAASRSSSAVLGNLINLEQLSSKNCKIESITFVNVAPPILKFRIVFVNGTFEPAYLEIK